MSNNLNVGRRDRGAVLPLALVVSVVFAFVATAIAAMAITSFRGAQVTERHVGALAAAEGGAQYATATLIDGGACADVVVGAGFVVNGVQPAVSCEVIEAECAHTVRSTATVDGLSRTIDAGVSSSGAVTSWSVTLGSSVALAGPTVLPGTC